MYTIFRMLSWVNVTPENKNEFTLCLFFSMPFFTILIFFFKKYMQKFTKKRLFMHILKHMKNIQSVSTVKQDNDMGKEI